MNDYDFEAARKQNDEWMQAHSPQRILGPWTYVKEHNPSGLGEGPALVYDKDLYISIWKDTYYLCIEQKDWTSQCLSELEYILAEHRLNCGYDPHCLEDLRLRYKGPMIDHLKDVIESNIEGMTDYELDNFLSHEGLGIELEDWIQEKSRYEKCKVPAKK